MCFAWFTSTKGWVYAEAAARLAASRRGRSGRVFCFERRAIGVQREDAQFRGSFYRRRQTGGCPVSRRADGRHPDSILRKWARLFQRNPLPSRRGGAGYRWERSKYCLGEGIMLFGSNSGRYRAEPLAFSARSVGRLMCTDEFIALLYRFDWIHFQSYQYRLIRIENSSFWLLFPLVFAGSHL